MSDRDDVDDAGEPRVVTLAFSHREIDRLYTVAHGSQRDLRSVIEAGSLPSGERLVGELGALVRDDLALVDALVARLSEAWDEAAAVPQTKTSKEPEAVAQAETEPAPAPVLKSAN